MSESAVPPISNADISNADLSNAEIETTTQIETNIEELSEGTVGVYDVEGMATILIHNDDVTPYEYVINILGDLFMLSEELADHVAWTAHSKGVAVVVVRPRDEAIKLVKVARGRARFVGYPLDFTIKQH